LITWWLWGLIGLLVSSIVLNWLAAIYNWRKVFVITKPLVLILLLTIFLILSKGDLQFFWFYLALVFSLAGDILLLYPMRAFILGLVAFLFAQVAYILGFNAILPPLVPALTAAFVVFLLVGMVYLVFQAEIRKKPDLKRMRPAILLYALMLSAMAASAVLNLFKPAWHSTAASLTALGGIFMMTYHLAQLLLVLGALIQYQMGG